jgi:hypothetical protein
VKIVRRAITPLNGMIADVLRPNKEGGLDSRGRARRFSRFSEADRRPMTSCYFSKIGLFPTLTVLFTMGFTALLSKV